MAGTFPGKVPATFYELLSGRACLATGLLMRSIVCGFIVAITFGLSLSAAQKPEDGSIPPSKKGDTLVVRGCVSGSLLKDLRGQKMDPVSGGETAIVYRLTGEKKLLQIIQKEHQDQILDVTGVLASNPDASSATRSKQMGKARVYVGAGNQQSSMPAQSTSYPTLRVTAFEVVRPGCT